MDNKRISCCFTGHRRIEKDKAPFINVALETEIEKMILGGIRNFYCGGAIGFDTLSETLFSFLKHNILRVFRLLESST